MQGPAGNARKMAEMSPDAGKLMALCAPWGPTWEGTDQALAACEYLRLASMLSNCRRAVPILSIDGRHAIVAYHANAITVCGNASSTIHHSQPSAVS